MLLCLVSLIIPHQVAKALGITTSALRMRRFRGSEDIDYIVNGKGRVMYLADSLEKHIDTFSSPPRVGKSNPSVTRSDAFGRFEDQEQPNKNNTKTKHEALTKDHRYMHSIGKINQKRIDEITSVFEDIRLLDINVAKCQQSIDELINYTRRIESDIQKLKDKKSNADEAHTMLEKLVEESNDQQQLNTQKIEESDYIQAARVLLQDDGIKTKIIKQYLPIMNQLINKYLASMDFFVNFKLDEEFNEKIRSRFRDEFSYLSFSEGEKMRIDLALLFTWRAVAKMKNSVSTNLLILDEIFDSSLDTTGTDDFL